MKKNKKIFFVLALLFLFLVVGGIFLAVNITSDKNKNKLPDKPKETPLPPPPSPQDTENWWLGDEEIEFAYAEMRKELGNSPKIQLVSPSVVRVIQETGEISEDLKKADYQRGFI